MWSTRRASRHHDEQKHVHERGLSPSVSSGGRTRMTSLSSVIRRSAVGGVVVTIMWPPCSNEFGFKFDVDLPSRSRPCPSLCDANSVDALLDSKNWLPVVLDRKLPGMASLAPVARDAIGEELLGCSVSSLTVGVGRHMLHPAPPHAMHSVAAAFCASPSDAWPPGGAAAAPSTERWDFVDFVLLNCRTAAGSTATSVSAATRVISLAMLFQSPGHVKKRPRPWKPQRFSAPSLRNSCTTRSPR
mmetsp:Transcript_91786/g.256363  ORF Transcript_91786/g.256363 Transcript_91786/m.256363 type:complete len:244 (-) Transcript_91786:52-783(-)